MSKLTQNDKNIIEEWINEVREDHTKELIIYNLTMHLFYDFMSKNEIKKKYWQLIAATCFFICYKLVTEHEYCILDYKVLNYICAHQYTTKKFLKMEKKILSYKDFSLIPLEYLSNTSKEEGSNS